MFHDVVADPFFVSVITIFSRFRDLWILFYTWWKNKSSSSDHNIHPWQLSNRFQEMIKHVIIIVKQKQQKEPDLNTLDSKGEKDTSK